MLQKLSSDTFSSVELLNSVGAKTEIGGWAPAVEGHIARNLQSRLLTPESAHLRLRRRLEGWSVSTLFLIVRLMEGRAEMSQSRADARWILPS